LDMAETGTASGVGRLDGLPDDLLVRVAQAACEANAYGVPPAMVSWSDAPQLRDLMCTCRTFQRSLAQFAHAARAECARQLGVRFVCVDGTLKLKGSSSLGSLLDRGMCPFDSSTHGDLLSAAEIRLLTRIASPLPMVHELELPGGRPLPLVCLRPCSRVEEITLEDVSLFDTLVLREMFSEGGAPELRSLHLRGSFRRSFGSMGVHDLVCGLRRHSRPLQILELSGCQIRPH